MPEFTGTKDLRTYLGILWRWKWLLLFFLVATPLAVYLIERSQPARYQSSALIGVNSASVNNITSGGGGSFTTNNVTAIAQLVTTTPVAQAAAAMFHPPANPGEIAGEVTATGNTVTNFVTITASDANPRRAAEIANAFAQAISANQQRAGATAIKSSIASLRSQIRGLGQNDPTRAQLESQLSSLEAQLVTQGSNAAILETAVPARAPVGLNTRRAIEIGLLVGLLLGIGAIVLAESADRRLRSPADLETVSELPLLSSIPASAFSNDLGDRDAEESFHTLRSAITYFKLDDPASSGTTGRGNLQSILVTGAAEKEGKTTVAIRLAIATAQAGLNVILIDGDLRRAQVAPRLGEMAEESGSKDSVRSSATGLAAVLSGEVSLEDVMFDYPLGDTAGKLTVVPAGPARSKPGVLVGSDAMRSVLAKAQSSSDLVIIDSPAALAVSDAVALMGHVSGVVLVARMERSTRAALSRVQQTVLRAGGRPLGVVATGVTVTGYGGYYYPSKAYTSDNGDRKRRRKEPEVPEKT